MLLTLSTLICHDFTRIQIDFCRNLSTFSAISDHRTKLLFFFWIWKVVFDVSLACCQTQRTSDAGAPISCFADALWERNTEKMLNFGASRWGQTRFKLQYLSGNWASHRMLLAN